MNYIIKLLSISVTVLLLNTYSGVTLNLGSFKPGIKLGFNYSNEINKLTVTKTTTYTLKKQLSQNIYPEANAYLGYNITDSVIANFNIYYSDLNGIPIKSYGLSIDFSFNPYNKLVFYCCSGVIIDYVSENKSILPGKFKTTNTNKFISFLMKYNANKNNYVFEFGYKFRKLKFNPDTEYGWTARQKELDLSGLFFKAGVEY